MSTRIRKTPHMMRKVPAQQRSRATVEAIVEAATRVLGRRGWAKFNTNEVAHVAGASVGSLYQYFPNKLSLVEAIRRRHFDAVIAVLETASNEPSESAVESLVEGMIRVHSANPSLHKALLEDAPRFSRASAAEEKFQKKYLVLYSAFVAVHRSRRNRSSNSLVARVLAAAIEGAVHHAATEGLSGSAPFKREVVSLARSYLSV